MTDTTLSPEDQAHKIQSLREMINSAEKTIHGARAMLLQLEGKKKAGRKRKVDEGDGSVVEGVFDGQIMIGTDGKQYPVPANYASKSKLVQGDLMKLTIVPDGSFIYKQIGPVARRHAIGIISQDERGNFHVVAEGKIYKVLLASITYFRAEPGDEVAIILPQDDDAQWTVIDSLLSSGNHIQNSAPATFTSTQPVTNAAQNEEINEGTSETIENLVKENANQKEATAPSSLLPPTQFFTQVDTDTTEKAEEKETSATATSKSPWSTDILNIEEELEKKVA